MTMFLIADAAGSLYTVRRASLKHRIRASIGVVKMIEYRLPPVDMDVQAFLRSEKRMEAWFADGGEHGFANGRLRRTWMRDLWLFDLSELSNLVGLTTLAGVVSVMRVKDLFPHDSGYYEFRSVADRKIRYAIQINGSMEPLLAEKEE